MAGSGRAWLFATAFASAVACAAPLDDVNQYADRCAAELGAGEGAYLPTGILPRPDDFSATQEIPVFWNQKRILFLETNPANGMPMPGTNNWEFVFDGLPGAVGYPDGGNTIGRIREANRGDLKCDYWSHVNKTNDACIGGARDGNVCDCPASSCSAVTGRCLGGANSGLRCAVANNCGGGTCRADVPTGCFPGQRAFQTDVGTCTGDITRSCSTDANCAGAGTCANKVTWSFVFRRLLPPKPGRAAFDPFHPYFFNNMDSIAFKTDTGGVCWFDTLLTATLQRDKWWEAPAGQIDGIPRPGGKDTAKKARAAAFWEHPAQVMNNASPGERCTACHGTGPILASRWIQQGDVFQMRRARELPYWHPARLLPNPFFKNFAATTTPATECGESCHNYWSVSAATTPGGTLARDMTALPTDSFASSYRKQIDAGGASFAKTCRAGPKVGQPCTDNTQCAGSTCIAGQNAGILREMPHPFGGSPALWNTDVLPAFNAMKACLRVCSGGARPGQVCSTDAECPAKPPPGPIPAGTCPMVANASCDGVEQATIPKFFGAQGPALPPLSQLVMAPVVAVNVSFARANCVVAADGSETCDYKAAWSDPTAGTSDYHAADNYYLTTNAVANRADQTPSTQRFCSSTNVPATADTTPINNWAKRYAARAKLDACTKTEIRLCGGYAIDMPVNANNAHAPVDSRNDGDAQRATLVTACANQIQATRSGYRLHRLTGRYVQTITLKNNATTSVMAPVTYLLLNLSANAKLFNASGATVAVTPAGSPFFSVALGTTNALAAGASVSFDLEFTNPTNQGITYDARVRVGAGQL